MALLLPIEEVGGGHRVPFRAKLWNCFPKRNDPLQVGKRPRVQNYGVDRRKAGSVHANPERQRQNGDRRRPRALGQNPQTKAEFRRNVGHVATWADPPLSVPPSCSGIRVCERDPVKNLASADVWMY